MKIMLPRIFWDFTDNFDRYFVIIITKIIMISKYLLEWKETSSATAEIDDGPYGASTLSYMSQLLQHISYVLIWVITTF